MRLLNARTYELVERYEVADDQESDYAILSHTWGVAKEEVSFEDIQPENLQRARDKPGFAKIRFAAEQAVRDGLEYVWVDTCCIDKSSSAELSEAINSMYRWYKKSRVCYVYLADVEDGSNFEELFRASRWFTRAWTLQEVIAPGALRFFSRDWARIGDRKDLYTKISAITKIDPRALTHEKSLDRFSVAQRMSWAAKREATRIEDIAYSLLGIFDVNMAMLYGEGSKAFTRLQEEIIKTSTDQSIFAWNTTDVRLTSLLLAPSPRYFEGSSDIVRVLASGNRSYQLTNSGLDIDLDISKAENGCISGLIDCKRKRSGLSVGLKLVLAYRANGGESVTTQTHGAYFVGHDRYGGYMYHSHLRKAKLSVSSSGSQAGLISSGRLEAVDFGWRGTPGRSMCRISLLRGTREEDMKVALRVRELPLRVVVLSGTHISMVESFPQLGWDRTISDTCWVLHHAIEPGSISGALRVTHHPGGRRDVTSIETVIAFGVQKQSTSIKRWLCTKSFLQSRGEGPQTPLSDAHRDWREPSETTELSTDGMVECISRVRDREYRARLRCELVNGIMLGTISVDAVENLTTP